MIRNKRVRGTEDARPTTVAGRLVSMAVAAALLALLTPGLAAAGAGPLAPPEGLAVFNRQEDAGGRVTLSWNGRDGAAGYMVYRSSSLDGPYREAGGVSAESFRDYPFFLDEAAPGGASYYKVACVAGDTTVGPMSAAVAAEAGKKRRISGPGKRILVSLGDQRAYFFENDVIVNILRVSTGAGGTPTGNYRITSHDGWVAGCAYWMTWRPNYGMHAWPSYLGSYEENLGVTPRSHGCIRLHPLEAYWPYTWAPDGTQFTVTGARFSGLPLQGQSTSVGATSPSETWYFAEGYFESNFLEYLLFFNPNKEQVVASTTYYPEAGGPVTENYLLPPGSRTTITVNHVTGLPANTGHGISVSADAPIVVQQSEYFNWADRRGGTTTIGVRSPERSWFFSEGYTGARFSTYLLLFNPREVAAKCHVTYTVEGAAPYHQDFVLPPETRGTMLVNALPGMMDKNVAIRVDSNQPIVTQRNTYFDWSGFTYGINGGHTNVGTAQPAKNWWLAEGCTGHYFDEYILMYNPTDKAANVQMEFATTTGPRGFSCVIPQFSRYTLCVDAVPGMENAEAGAAIASDTDIVVERSMYCGRDSRRGGDVASGITTLSKDWYFAEGYTGGTFDEYVLVMNPHAEPAVVNLVFHCEDGSDAGFQYVVNPRTRLTVHVDDLPGVGWTGSSVEVHADRPLAVEQAHYFCIPR